jgi:hypothetical protein
MSRAGFQPPPVRLKKTCLRGNTCQKCKTNPTNSGVPSSINSAAHKEKEKEKEPLLFPMQHNFSYMVPNLDRKLTA